MITTGLVTAFFVIDFNFHQRGTARLGLGLDDRKVPANAADLDFVFGPFGYNKLPCHDAAHPNGTVTTQTRTGENKLTRRISALLRNETAVALQLN